MTKKDNRSSTRKLRAPAFSGALVVDTPNGSLRVRKWPRKRGKNVAPAVKIQNKWFSDAVKMIKYVSADQQRESFEAVKGTGLLPRDILMRGISEGFYDFIEPDGQVISYRRKGLVKVAYQGCILPIEEGFTPQANNNVVLEWGLPIIDTAGLFSINEPGFITIPEGVQIIDLTCAVVTESGAAAQMSLFLRNVATTAIYAGNTSGAVFTRSFASVSTGPILVNEGDQFSATVRQTQSKEIQHGNSHFQCNILEALN